MSGELSAQIVERSPLDQTRGNSDNAIERVTLADGRALILKRVSPEWDWLSRATNDDGRVATMWESGIFHRMPATVDHAIEAVERDGSEWNIFMRDVSRHMLSEAIPHDRSTVKRMLARIADLHAAFMDAELPQLCSIEDRYGMLSLRTAERERANGHPAGDVIVQGWEAFTANTPRDLAQMIAALSEDPSGIADQLRGCSQTLVHGDLRIGNAGFDGETLVLIDWGDRTGVAPPAVDLAWFIGFDAKRVAVSRDEIVADFREVCGDRFDHRAFDLAMIGGLVHLAPHIGLRFLSTKDGSHDAAADELSWWVGTVERALETWSP